MREDFKNRLLQKAKTKASMLGVEITSEAESDLVSFINQGIDRMSSSEYDSIDDRLTAERNIETLIESMSYSAKSRNLNESLDDRSFSFAKSNICPLWPFC
ncbi:hypothetical protein OO013_05705 [Mangrovivirga sp. M17]|uniref:Uncharacterized protein n=1 Tax=Mangrovivirga halotolerans TaxID=2993936 RepID=A0ABT3RQA5_9BACT|nr:hypothetical protein [Mangrovivirga halotolerans]MCX2743350.1 hypothetical protein [Mangrovivirga halotolerans]